MFGAEFILKSYIRHYISEVPPKYSYAEESGVNPAFQSIEEVSQRLCEDAKRIFTLRSTLDLITGVKNAEQQHGYYGLRETFEESSYPYLNWEDRYGHSSLAIPEEYYNGNVFYAGFLCQRSEYLEVFLSSGRFNRHNRAQENIYPLTPEQIQVIEAFLVLKFHKAYGEQDVIFYDTVPGIQDDEDSAVFFSNKLFPADKPKRVYTPHTIKIAVELAYQQMHFENAQNYISANIPPVYPKYSYDNEHCINPGYHDIENVKHPLRLLEKRIWALRTDFILALGVKNAYRKEHGYTGMEDSFSESLHSFLNWNDRYGHPSLTLREGEYDGGVYYAGYICQRRGYLQVYLVSGRYERTDLNEEQTRILEAYLAAQFQVAYGNQDIVFDYGDSDNPMYHTIFFSHGIFDSTNPQRRYNSVIVNDILQGIAQSCEKPISTNARSLASCS